MRGLGGGKRSGSAPSSSSSSSGSSRPGGSRSSGSRPPAAPRDGAPRLTIPDVISSTQNPHSPPGRAVQQPPPSGSSARVAMVTQGWPPGASGASGSGSSGQGGAAGGAGGARNSNTAPGPRRSLAGMKVCIQQGCTNRANTLNGVFPSTSQGGASGGGGGASGGGLRQHVEIRCSPPSLPQCRGHPLAAATNRPQLDMNNANHHPIAPAAVSVSPPVVPVQAAAAVVAVAPVSANSRTTPEALPDILNSHVPPTSPAPPPYPQRPNQHRHPLSAAAVATPPRRTAGGDVVAPRRGASRARSSSSSLAWFGRLSASPVTTLDSSSTSLGGNHGGGGRSLGGMLASLQDKRCCTGPAVRRCLTLVTTFRWVLVGLALLGVGCVVTGIVLGVLHMSMGSSFLTLSLMFIGLGVLLVIVVGVGWRCTPPGHEPCHLLFHLGEHGALPHHPGDNRGQGDSRRPLHWYGGVLYPEFRFRRPPPSYSASMQEYNQQLMMAQLNNTSPCHHASPPPPAPPAAAPPSASASAAADNNDYDIPSDPDLPSSPPPTYRSQAPGTLRPGIHITFPCPPPDRSRPPTYRAVPPTQRPGLAAAVAGACRDGGGGATEYERPRPRSTMTLQRYQEQQQQQQQQCAMRNHNNCNARGSRSLRRACSTVEPGARPPPPQQQQLYDTPPPPRLHCSLENMLDVTAMERYQQQQEVCGGGCGGGCMSQQQQLNNHHHHHHQCLQRYSMEDILGAGTCQQPQPQPQQQQQQPHQSGVEQDRTATLNRLVEQEPNMSTLNRAEQVVQYLDGLLDEQLRSMSGGREHQSDTLSSTHSYRGGASGAVGGACRHGSYSPSTSRSRENSYSNDDIVGEVADTPL